MASVPSAPLQRHHPAADCNGALAHIQRPQRVGCGDAGFDVTPVFVRRGMGAEPTGIGKKPRNDLVRADHMGATCLDQFDHHAQHGVVPAGYQGAENPRHLGQRLQRRTDIAPLRPSPHRTGKDDPVDSLGLESAADRGKVSDCTNGMVEAGPIRIGLTRKRNDERVFTLKACGLGHVMGKRSGAGDDGEPAF